MIAFGTRAADLQAALRLMYLSLAWMTLEGAAALWLGARSHKPAAGRLRRGQRD